MSSRSPQPPTALALRDVVVRRGGRALVDTVTVCARAGELLAIVGPNGAGKSTLLGVMAGLIRPTSGDVTLGGEPLGTQSLSELARRRAVLTQRVALPFELSALELVLLGRAPHGDIPGQHDLDIAWTCLAEVGAATLAEREVSTLSGGELQRVHLARVFAQAGRHSGARDHVLLLDEPTAALDPGHARLMLSLARAEARHGALVVVILHDLALAAEFADSVLLLANGRPLAAGPPVTALTAGTLQEAFGLPATVLTHPTAGTPLPVFFGENP